MFTLGWEGPEVHMERDVRTQEEQLAIQRGEKGAQKWGVNEVTYAFIRSFLHSVDIYREPVWSQPLFWVLGLWW